ncbi:MAG: SpoIIE family protein phosphatase [SAR324 cluster bacterium]|nr:SpoIIE family protein phosphatase [SAR324 cluster bacterium]
MTGIKILIVEDNIVASTSLRVFLEKLEYEVIALVESGEEAVEQAKAHNPDLIFMDIELKGEMDGIEAVQQINLSFEIPVIYLTANAEIERLEKILETNSAGYLKKPVQLREVQGAIEMALNRQQIEKNIKEIHEHAKDDFLTNRAENHTLPPPDIITAQESIATRHLLDQNREIIEYLKDSRLFSHLPERLLQQLVPLSELKEFPAGTKILTEGELNQNVFFLIRGLVGVYAEGHLILELRRKGDIVGEMGVISDRPASATVIAETPVTMFSIKAREIGKFTDIDSDALHHTLYRIFSMILTEKLTLTTAKAKDYERAQKRLLHENSHRKLLEEELLEYKENLETLVKDRTLKLEAVNQKLEQEIIDHTQTEERLRNSERKYRYLFEALREGVWVVDEHFNTTFVNPHMAKMLGYTENEMLEQHFFAFMDKQDVVQVKNKLALRKLGITDQFEIELIRKDGHTISALVAMSPMTDKSDNYEGLIAAVTDITQQKQMAAELQKREVDKEKMSLAEIKEELEIHQGLSDTLIQAGLKLKELNEQMEEEVKLAAEFQQSIIIVHDIFDFLKSAQRYLPHSLVSGDVYRISSNRDGDANIFIGDATGHGTAAALFTMMVNMILINTPGHLATNAVLSRCNLLLASQEIRGKSMTAIFFRVTPTGKLTVANGGHPPLIILPADGTDAVLLTPEGCGLGLFFDEFIPYEELTYQLHPGDKIITYTDGISEWENPNKEQFKTKRIVSYLEKNRNLSVNHMLDGLMAEVKVFAQGAPCKDDLTLLAFQYR